MQYYLKTITIELLPDFVKQEIGRKGPTAISPWRGISQALNPRSVPSDPVLFLLYEGDLIRAYLGCLPDWCWKGSEVHRCAWLTTLWVDPVARGMGLAKRLVTEAMAQWDERILMTEYTPEAGDMYKRTGLFSTWTGLIGFRGYIQPDFAGILPPKGQFFRRIKPLLRLMDFILRPFTDVRLSYYIPEQPNIDYVHEIDLECADFIHLLSERESSRRGGIELNWVLGFPWVFDIPPIDGFVEDRYNFTSLSPNFKQYSCKVLDEAGKMIGFILWTMREGHLKVRYCYALPEGYAAVAETINYHAFALRARMVTCLHEGVAAVLQNLKRSPYFFRKAHQQPVLVSHIFGSSDQFRFQSGDGDAVFT